MNKKSFKFTPQDKEWHGILTNLFTNILDLKTKPVLIYDSSQIRKYVTLNSAVGRNSANSLWGACVSESGLFWISPHLKSEPLIETVNTIFHELLHIKYPKATEKFILELADKFVPMYENLSSNKKGICKVWTPKKGWNKHLKVDESKIQPVGKRK